MADLDPKALKQLNTYKVMGNDQLPEIISERKLLLNDGDKILFVRTEGDQCFYWFSEGFTDRLDDEVLEQDHPSG
jgi:hypothetical protein